MKAKMFATLVVAVSVFGIGCDVSTDNRDSASSSSGTGGDGGEGGTGGAGGSGGEGAGTADAWPDVVVPVADCKQTANYVPCIAPDDTAPRVCILGECVRACDVDIECDDKDPCTEEECFWGHCQVREEICF